MIIAPLTTAEIKTRESYKRIAKDYNATLFNPNYKQPHYEKFKNLLPSGKVIDIGCGTGRDSLFFLQNGYDYVGIDVVEEMLEQSKLFAPEGTFTQMDMSDMEFEGNTFDGFWAIASLIHIPKQDINNVLQEIKRVTKDGGIGFISMTKGDGEQIIQGTNEGDERFFAFYQENEFAEILENNGLEVLEHTSETINFKPPKKSIERLLYFVRVKK